MPAEAGNAKGFVFLSLEDETGIANTIITPQLFHRDHTVVVHHPLLMIEGGLQNLDHVVSIKAERIEPLAVTRAEPDSHDFHCVAAGKTRRKQRTRPRWEL